MVDNRCALFSTFVGLVVCVGCSSTGDEIPNDPGAGTSGSAGSNTAGRSAAGSNTAGSSSNSGGSSMAGSSAAGSNTGGTGGGSAGASVGQGGAQSTGGRGGGQTGGMAGAQQGGAGTSFGGTGGVAQGGSAGSGTAGAGGGPASDAPADLFAYYCFDCHGERGAGTMLAPEIQHPVHDYSNWVVRNGLPGTGFRDPMEAIEPEVLSDALLETILDWLDEPPQPTTGEGLYLDYCGNCHGADGSGGPTMRPITNELRELEAIVREGAHLGDFANRREYMPAYPATRLTDGEVDLIYDYVDSL